MRRLIHDVIDGIEELQSLPTLALDVMAMLNDPSVSVKEVAGKIILDQSLVSFILKQCNSPLYGIKEKIITLSKAINLLGFTRIKSIMMSYFMRNMYRLAGSDKFKNYLWKHSIGVALFCREIGLHLTGKVSEGLYILGLLHDIGKLVLFLHKPEIYKEIINKAESTANDFVKIEKGIYGFDHAECGAMLLEEWKFPPEIINPVLYHHNESKYFKNADYNVAIVALANILYYNVLIEDNSPVLDDIFNQFGFNPNEIQKISEETTRKYPEYLKSMGLK
jgi:putative nucleotidyltransferase with HDIG domain